MARYGIISDIHGNLPAFEAALRRLGHLQIDDLVCLGDIVGYGPRPDRCIDLVHRHCSVIVQGNHDEAVIDTDCADVFNGPARTAILWTRDVLSGLHLNALTKLRPTAVISGETADTPDVLCVHASPRLDDYDDYLHDKQAAGRAFELLEHPICLIGHTHVPMVFETVVELSGTVPSNDDIVAYLPGDGIEHDLAPDCRYLCNPGSVGQPRDCDPRASIAILDTTARTFTVYRTEYDIAAAQRASMEAGLPGVLAERLGVGA
ncbi:MAG: metallophosphoesterase family protein [Planctomycetota bacterium]|jgi:predicted phosphodiesterase